MFSFSFELVSSLLTVFRDSFSLLELSSVFDSVVSIGDSTLSFTAVGELSDTTFLEILILGLAFIFLGLILIFVLGDFCLLSCSDLI